MDNKAVIPIYMNNDIINNLFTIVVEEFVEIKTVNTRNQVVVNVNTPLNELNYDPCKPYVQGDFNIQLLNEFSKQRTEESISKLILVFLKLKSILSDNGLLKDMDSESSINDIKVNDFVQFTSGFSLDPSYEYAENVLKTMETKSASSPEEMEESEKQILNLLKRDIDTLKNDRCVKMVSDGIGKTNKKAIVPIELKHMADNFDYMSDSQMTVLGKVVKVNESFRSYEDNGNDNVIKSRTCLDYLEDEYAQKIKEKYKNTKLNSNAYSYSADKLSSADSFIEVVPIAMYI